MKTKISSIRKGLMGTGLAVIVGVALGLPASVPPTMADPGQILDNSGFIPFDPAFFQFEVEDPLESLKGVATWNEIEKMLDNPYAFALAPDVGGNTQGWPSYVSTNPRRHSFLPPGCHYGDAASGRPACNDALLPPFVIHPLNYNYMTGEELRLVNPQYPGGTLDIPTEMLEGPVGTFTWQYETMDISPGSERFDPDEQEAFLDFNSPMKADEAACIISTEPIPAEGATICGGDPGEPGYAGFGVNSPAGYSTPAVPGGTAVLNDDGTQTVHSIVGLNLFDPQRGEIEPRNATTGAGGLNKPSLRVPDAGGTPSRPNYIINSAANLSADPTALLPSNENDYVRNRDVAIALGKSLFWDMQVGSDSVQSCGTCHFAPGGGDTRSRNQLNPNHLGLDFDLEVFSNRGAPDPQNNNQDVVVADFPFHKLTNPAIPGERASDGDGIVDFNPGNVASHANDVMSSMGVVFGKFRDIAPPGGGRGSAAAFVQTPGTAPRSLMPDLRSLNPVENLDPIPLFQGLRRVEPRQTPTFFAAAMNFDNFWDGRARHDFNGGSVFGPADPFTHVYACRPNALGICPLLGTLGSRLVATRQIIRFSSLASLATGPALSEFEMSFLGRSWPKIGKKLLQNGVVPLANQLVSPHDSVLGRYSNQPGNSSPVCSFIPGLNGPRLAARAAGKPGLCITYNELIGRAFYPGLWASLTTHLNGAPAPCTSVVLGNRTPAGCDPFDGYVLSIANGLASPINTNQFTQMEANMSLFFGLSVHLWGNILIPDNTPEDKFFDANPDAFITFGESNEPLLTDDLLNCGQPNPLNNNIPQDQPCFTPVGNFKRDNGLTAFIGGTLEGGTDATPVIVPGTRTAGSPDPLLGLDMFLGSNMSLKNPDFRSFRCGECHAAGNLTDATFETTHQLSFGDFVQEFRTGQPGIELAPEPLGRSRVIAGFALEGELGENAQDAVERNMADLTLDEVGAPQGQALFDNGIYNIGVTPIENDVSRGGDDPFGWPLSLAVLALKNLGGPDYHPGGNNPANNFALPPAPGIPLPTFDPEADPECAALPPEELTYHGACNTGGLFEENAQDQQLNPGFGEEPANPLLPPYLAKWASNVVVGDETQQDEVFVGLNTLMEEPMQEGFVDNNGPFNPAGVLGENYNMADQPQMATWPNVNRVNTQGSFKAAPLRNVELTSPFFHNGGKLTLRQVVDFYMRGGDFPKTNAAHRDFLIANLAIEDEALGGMTAAQKEERMVALVDFLLELTDDRVRFEQAPFDHPEVFIPLDGKAPDNTFGRPGFLALTTGICPGGGVACFKQIPAVGVGGNAVAAPGFLGVVKGNRNSPNCNSASGPVSHYCATVQ